MGIVKQLGIEAAERGWTAPDNKFVCSDCVGDDFLKRIVASHAVETECSYCGQSQEKAIAAPFENLMPTIASAVQYFYDDPASACSMWETICYRQKRF